MNELKKVILVLPLFVLVASLLIGTAMATPTNNDKDEKPDQVCAIATCMFPVSCPEKEWCAGNTIHIRDQDAKDCVILKDDHEFVLVGKGCYDINSNINVKQGQAQNHITVDWKFGCGGFCGEMELHTKCVCHDFGQGEGHTELHGYGAFEGQKLNLDVEMCGCTLFMQGHLVMPDGQELCNYN